ncbi:hypothetical protein [Mesorhizobium sp. M0870]|uniref:hypothetical protein n=1 Tax=Mesorhizobium sp. M0870 TaxID=2957016 RepID=UPI0033380C40
MLAEINLRRMVAEDVSSNFLKEQQFREDAGRVLLASIVGMAVAGLWIWIGARAGG